MVTVAQINELRKATQVSMLLCKQALEATGGDFDAAREWLRGQGREVAGEAGVFGVTLFADGATTGSEVTSGYVYNDGHTAIDIRGFSGTTPTCVWGDLRHQVILRPAKN
jgi:hypothetical protein